MSPAAQRGLLQWCRWLEIEPGRCTNYTSSIDYEPVKLKQVLDGGLALALKAGRTLQAMAVIAGLETELGRLQAERGIHKRMPEAQRKRIMIVASTDPLQIAGAWVHDVVEMAGGRLCFDAGESLYRDVTPEEIAESRPDLILVPEGLQLDLITPAPVIEVDHLSDCFIPGPDLYACIRRLMDVITP